MCTKQHATLRTRLWALTLVVGLAALLMASDAVAQRGSGGPGGGERGSRGGRGGPQMPPEQMDAVLTLQAAVGSATPPFGCDIFTAQLIFRRPYLEVIGHALPFLLILILATIILIAFPQIALFLPRLALGG